MERPAISAANCTDLAYESLKAANVNILDSDVEALAENIKQAIDSWFGDMKHLTPNYRPMWGNER